MGVPDTSLPGPLEGTDFVPSEEEREDLEKTFQEIKERRICSTPFPLAGEDVNFEYQEFEAQLLADVSSPAFLKLGEYIHGTD